MKVSDRNPKQHFKASRFEIKGTLMRYAIVIEKAEHNFSAYVPDLPGCMATGKTLEETEAQIREAIEFHIEGLREDGLPIPAPLAALNISILRPNKFFYSKRSVL